MTTAPLPATLKVFERGWLSSNNILLHGASGNTLIDTGYVSHAPQTLALVQSALGKAPLHLVINTHLHADHCGGNAALQQRYGMPVAVAAHEADAVRNWDERRLSFAATGQNCARFTAERTLEAGERLELGDMQWDVLGAPGHDPHSLMLLCDQHGILISADALWENGFGVIFPELTGESGFAEQQAVLELIAQLRPRVVIPGHGAPFHGERVPAALARAHSRLAHLRADPLRNARHALKVLIAFKLLEARVLSLSQLQAMLRDAAILRRCAAILLGEALSEPHEADAARAALLLLLLSELERVNVLSLQGQHVHAV